VNVGKIFFTLYKIDRLNTGKDEQYSGGHGNTSHSESRKIFNRLKQSGVNGSAIALFEFKEATVMIAVAIILHRLGRQTELFVKQFLCRFFRGKGHRKTEGTTDGESSTSRGEKKESNNRKSKREMLSLS
jgi:hypothetical protein